MTRSLKSMLPAACVALIAAAVHPFSAGAQPRPDAPAASASASAPAPAVTTPPPPPATIAPTPPPAPPPAATAAAQQPVFVAMPGPEQQRDTRTDHEKVVGKLGVSWLGISEIPIADANPTGTASSPGLTPNDRVEIKNAAAPVIGVRWWLTRLIAIEPGIGFSYTGGGTKSDLNGSKAEVDKKSTTAMMFHIAAPLALASARHIALLLIPEVNWGYAQSTVKSLLKDQAPPDAKLSGMRFDLGVRAGGEIHFGFMGIPELSLEGSIGMLYSFQQATASAGKQSVTDTNHMFTTSSFNNPWDIFKGYGTVAARYYF